MSRNDKYQLHATRMYACRYWLDNGTHLSLPLSLSLLPLSPSLSLPLVNDVIPLLVESHEIHIEHLLSRSSGQTMILKTNHLCQWLESLASFYTTLTAQRLLLMEVPYNIHVWSDVCQEMLTWRKTLRLFDPCPPALMDRIFILWIFPWVNDYIEPMEIFAAWVKIYSMEHFCNVRRVCSWLGGNICLVNISGCTGYCTI